jgi:hypothetical protein
MARSVLAVLIAVFAGAIHAQNACDSLLEQFIAHNPLWQFRSEVGARGPVYICSFAADERWGADATTAWTNKCTEEAKRHIACAAPVGGKSLVIRDVSKPARIQADDGITYYEVRVVTGVA